MIEIKRLRGVLHPALLAELEALRLLEAAVLAHDHGTGIKPGPGRSHHPCSLCDALDDVKRARRGGVTG